MTDIIRVDHEALAKIAAGFGRESAAVAQMLQQVTQAMQKLQSGGWMGRGAEAFFAEMEQKVIPAVRRLIEALAEADRTTKTISTMMKSADEEAASGFRDDVTNAGGGTSAGNSGGSSGLDSSVGAETIGGGTGVGNGTGEGTGDGSESGGGSGADSRPFGDSAFGDNGTGLGASIDAGGMGTGDNSAGTGLYDGGLGLAADDMNSLLGAGSALWHDDSLLAGGGSFGDTLDNNFFPGDYIGSNYLSDPYGFGTDADYGIPADWLADVNDSLSDYLQSTYDDYGIPRDWLDGVHDAVVDDLQGGELTDSDFRSSDADSASGGDSSSGNSGGSGSGSGGGNDTGTPAASPLSDSGTGSGSGGTDGGTGGGTGSMDSGTGFGSGSMGGGAGSGFPSALNHPAADFPSSAAGIDSAQTATVSPRPVRFAYQALGSSGAGEGGSRYFTAFGAAGGGTLPTAVPTQTNMGLPLSLAALSPFLALFGKALKRKSDER